MTEYSAKHWAEACKRICSGTQEQIAEIKGIANLPQKSVKEMAQSIDTNVLANTSLDNLTQAGQEKLGGAYKLIETYQNGANWYKIFEETQSDGSKKYWCEQGGKITNGMSVINFLVSYNSTQYTVTYSQRGTSSYSIGRISFDTLNKNGISISGTSSSNTPASWKTEGYCNKPEETL